MPTITKSRSKWKATNTGTAKGNAQLEKFFVDALKDIYWAEKALIRALPKMERAATTDEVKDTIEVHLAQTHEHVLRLEEAFEMLGKKAQSKKCEAMEGLIKESESLLEETENGTMTRDVAIIAAAQKIEHYEIATYGTLVTLANVIGQTEVAELLAETLEEEREADHHLSFIAETGINWSVEDEIEETE